MGEVLKMPPHNLPATDDVPLRKNTIIDRCKEVVSSISQKAETFNWQEQIPSGLKENAQFAWEKVKEQTTMENLISQVKESPFWDLPPTALVLIGICLLPVASCISFFITSISLLFIAFLAFEGTMMTIGAAIAAALLVSLIGMGLSIAVVSGMTYFVVDNLVIFFKSTIANMQSSTEPVVVLPESKDNQISKKR